MTLSLDEAQEVLVKSGWFPSRKVDISTWVDALAKHRLHLSAAAKTFLEEFGRIEVRQSGTGVNAARVRFVIDPMMVAWMTEWIRDLESELGGHLSPLGEAGWGGEGSLVMDESGELLMVCEDGIGRVAFRFGAGHQAMLNLVQGYHESKTRIDEE